MSGYIYIKRIEFDEFGKITAIEFHEGAEAKTTLRFIVENYLNGGSPDKIREALFQELKEALNSTHDTP